MEHFSVFHLFLWDPILFEGTPYEVNRVVLLTFLAAAACITFFVLGGKGQLIPKGIQNVAESAYLFVRDRIAIDIIGPEGVKYSDYLTTLFFFILFCNVLEVLPGIHLPVTARMAIPAFLAFMTYIIYNFVGFQKQGFRYLKNILFPPGVPWPVYIILTPIEFFSVFLIRPMTLAIRLMANMMAGSVLLALFFIFTDDLLTSKSVGIVLAPVTFLVAVGLFFFEMLVIFIQAYIFTLLSAFYIAESLHGHGDEPHLDTAHVTGGSEPPRHQLEGIAEGTV
ncbi:MAG TPA: F0F1 ATP synthase subunit A [Actinomycetota bacterium]|nr:F0F1 ATP synthase subunit A [Actinomycetota bacterium]